MSTPSRAKQNMVTNSANRSVARLEGNDNQYNRNLPTFGQSLINQNHSNDFNHSSPVRNSLQSVNMSVNDQEIISQLKKKVFELEQSEKSYNLLNAQYRSLQSEMAHSSEERIRHEHDYKQRIELLERKVTELTNNNKLLEDIVSDLKAKNKKLYNELTNLEKSLTQRNIEHEQLSNQLADLISIRRAVEEEKSALEKLVSELTDYKNRCKDQLDKYFEENDYLKKIVDEQELDIKNLDIENQKLKNQLDEKSLELKNLVMKLTRKEDTINDLNNKVEELSRFNHKQNVELKNLENQSNHYRQEIADLNEQNKLESQNKIDFQKDNEILGEKLKQVENILKKKLEELKETVEENDQLQIEIDNLAVENEMLHNHANMLTEQNVQLVGILSKVGEQDDKIKSHLNRRTKFTNILAHNQNSIDETMRLLDGNAFEENKVRYRSRDKLTETNDQDKDTKQSVNIGSLLLEKRNQSNSLLNNITTKKKPKDYKDSSGTQVQTQSKNSSSQSGAPQGGLKQNILNINKQITKNGKSDK